MNIAIFSPNKNPYSETFIQAHKNGLSGNVFYYYGMGSQMQLEGGVLIKSKVKKLQWKVIQKLGNKEASYVKDQIILNSLKTNKIDVVLAEYATHAHRILPVVKKLGLPLVVHFHGFDAASYNVLAGYNNYKEVFSYAKTIIVVSTRMERMLLDIGCPGEKLVYNVYGPRPEFLEINPTFSKKQFVAFGRFTDKKAPYYLILTFKKVIQKYPNATLVIGGTGALLDVCQNLVRYFNLDLSVRFLGVISKDEIIELFQESLAFVQHSIRPSSGDMEGTPLAILEASAAGLPVISTEHAGIPDVILHNETGLLCQEHEVDKMAEHMLQLLEDVSIARNLGAAGKKRVYRYFTLERHIEKLQDILVSAVNN